MDWIGDWIVPGLGLLVMAAVVEECMRKGGLLRAVVVTAVAVAAISAFAVYAHQTGLFGPPSPERSALPESRNEFERFVASYSDPTSKISKAGGWLGDLIASFVAQAGGPFSASEIDEIRQAEKDEAASLAVVQEAVECMGRLEAARRRHELIADAVSRGVTLEELGLSDIRVPD
jgi:hypothetical protein